MTNRKLYITPILAICFMVGTATAQTGVNHKLAIEISECGLNYVTASKRLANRVILDPFTEQYLPVSQPATVQLNGIPECAPIEKAYIWWDMAGGTNNQTIKVEDPNGNSTTYSGTLIGNHSSSKCWWGYNRTRTFRAEITGTIAGNGNYKVSGVPQANASGQGNADTDGFTIMVFYKDPSATYEGHVVIWDGGDVVDSQPFQVESGKTSQTISGLSVCGNSSFGESFMIVADMQYNDKKAKISMNNGQAKEMTAGFWNFEKQNTTVNTSQTSSKFTVESGGYLRPADNKWVVPADCYNFIMMGLYYRTTSCKTCTPSAGADPIVLSGQKTDPTCAGQSGEITINATGGNGNFTYKWQPPVSTGPTATGLAPGVYTVTVESGCQEEQTSVTLEPSGEINATATYQYNDGCDRFGGATGDATVIPSGGTPPYTYQWDDPGQQTTPTAIGLSMGTHNVTILDINGCGATATVTIEHKIQIDIIVDSEPCAGCTDGQLTGSVTGFGKTPFTYRWDDPNEQTTQTATGLAPGTYVLIVTDAEGCFNSDTVSVGITDLRDQISDLSNQISVYPNPSSGSFTVGIPGNEKVELKVFDPRGKVIISRQYAGSEVENIQLNVSDGIYFIQVLTANEIITKQLLITNSK